MFVSNTELLNKLLQLESKIDQNKHKNDNTQTKNDVDKHQDIDKHQDTFTRLESIEQKLTSIDSNINHIDSNINHIYFENQIIKHQLLLEDCIRESLNEINDLSSLIKNTVSKINKLIS